MSEILATATHTLTRPLRASLPGEAGAGDRFTRLPGADLAALRQAHVILIGAGGLGGEVGHGLVRKGVGRLTILDFDTVELSNLGRQQFFVGDIGANKALALARNLIPHATGRTQLDAYPVAFQTAQQTINLTGNVAVVGVDNMATRVAAARYYQALGVPVIFIAVDVNASKGYCYVQTSRPGAPCFLCLFPEAEQDRTTNGCSGASIEILKIVGGLALYAVDSLLMARPRPWTYKEVFLDGAGDGGKLISARAACPLCGKE